VSSQPAQEPGTEPGTLPGPLPGDPLGPVISSDQLAALLATTDRPVVLDVRWRLGGPPGIGSYLAGHLPKACFIDLDKDLSGRPGKAGRHPLPEPRVVQAAMRTAGLRSGQLAVAYDDGDSTVAARLWWTLRYYGHDQVAVLDGGYRGWCSAGLPLTRVVSRPEPGDFTITTSGQMPVLDDVQAAELARSGFLLDARAGERYRGEVEPVDRVGGHIPGAISAPTKGNVTADGRFRDRAALVRRFADLGLPGAGQAGAGQAGAGQAGAGQAGAGQPDVGQAGPDRAPQIGAYCGSGVTAAHQVLALQLAGLRAALYVGSWSNWSSDPSRPVATGPDPG
jgi:thiosulfate/3-mercaptopyruvate sulfurtransferase